MLRNPAGYERATTLLADLCELARRSGAADGFIRRLGDTRARHARKAQFIARLDAAGLSGK